jgi:hypothetical protein
MENPLTEAKPTSLDELFNRDPLDLADKDIDVIVAEFTRQRRAWVEAEAAGKAPRAKAAPGGESNRAKAAKLTLEDLDLD